MNLFESASLPGFYGGEHLPTTFGATVHGTWPRQVLHFGCQRFGLANADDREGILVLVDWIRLARMNACGNRKEYMTSRLEFSQEKITTR